MGAIKTESTESDDWMLGCGEEVVNGDTWVSKLGNWVKGAFCHADTLAPAFLTLFPSGSDA